MDFIIFSNMYTMYFNYLHPCYFLLSLPHSHSPSFQLAPLFIVIVCDPRSFTGIVDRSVGGSLLTSLEKSS